MKSPPELWTDLQGERLREAVGGAELETVEDERRIEWTADEAHGTAVLEPAGWGTKLTLTAEIDQLEPEAARLGFWQRMRGERPLPPEPSKQDELRAALEGLLDDLGSAHRKPFQNG